MRDLSRLWAWTPLFPRVVDISVVVVLSIIGLASIPFDGFVRKQHGSLAIGAAILLVGALQLIQPVSLLWRRTHPTEVVAISIAAFLIKAILGVVTASGAFSLLVAVYTVSAYGDRIVRTVVGAGLGAVAVACFGLVAISLGRLQNFGTYGAQAVSFGISWLIGDYRRTRRAFERSLEAQRLVAAQDGERRRLERNLHDGAQQNLVALKVRLGLVRGFLENDPQRARTMLDDLGKDAGAAIEALRELARGINPPILADFGLVAALQAQAQRIPVPVDLVADSVPRYPADVESAIYFCCLEALQKVVKHAQASHVTVTLLQHDGELRFSVADDGRGIDPAGAGPGQHGGAAYRPGRIANGRDQSRDSRAFSAPGSDLFALPNRSR